MLDGVGMLSTKPARWVNALRRALFPPACLFCAEPLPEDGCCGDCLAGIRAWPRHACRQCGRALEAAMSPGPCGACLKQPPPMRECRHLFVYAGPVRDAILEWKLRGRAAGAAWLVKAAGARLR